MQVNTLRKKENMKVARSETEKPLFNDGKCRSWGSFQILFFELFLCEPQQMKTPFLLATDRQATNPQDAKISKIKLKTVRLQSDMAGEEKSKK